MIVDNPTPVRDFGLPRFADPVVEDKDAEREVFALMATAQERVIADGKKFTQAHADSVRFFYEASEQYLGPLTAASVAGWMRRHLVIQPKGGGLIPFELNEPQWHLLCELVDMLVQGLPVRAVVLKARQFGFSTLIQGFIFFLVSRRPACNATTVAHKLDASLNLVEMTQRFLRGLRFLPRVLSNSLRNGIVLANESRITVDTAENKEVKRSFMNSFVHCSETAFWPYAATTSLGLAQTCPDMPWTMLVDESTANGVGGVFHDRYWAAKEGKNSFRALFFPWTRFHEYRLNISVAAKEKILANLDLEEREGLAKLNWSIEQLAWRRRKIADACDGDVAKFHQEYPSTDRQAFLVSGRPVFDQTMLEERREYARRSEVVFQGFALYDGTPDTPISTTGEAT